MIAPDFPAVEALVRASALFRAAEALTVALVNAIDHSATAARLRAARDRFAPLTPVERLRALAIFIAVASAGHVVLLTFEPAVVIPAIPKAMWILVAATAALVAVYPRAVADHWRASTLRALIARRLHRA